MIAFEVSINGEKVCTAGLLPLGVISAILSYTRLAEGETLHFGVNGAVSDQAENGDYLTWIAETLQPGDTITIRIVEVAESDEPKERISFADLLKRGSPSESPLTKQPTTQPAQEKRRTPHLRNPRSRRR